MSLSALQLASIIAAVITTAALIVVVPLLLMALTSRIRVAAHDSTRAALADVARQHEQFLRQQQQALAEAARQHERAVSEYSRQHERAMSELGAEHLRIAREFGMFSQKRHQVYARLYARYRRATRDLGAALTGNEPDFPKFSRDDLLRYLKSHNIREKDATDAIAAIDRGDVFAMSKLMARLHWRVTVRDATAALEKAREFESLNELYLSDAVRDSVGNVRRKMEAVAFSLTREQERGDASRRTAKQDELHSAVASLLVAMRSDLHPGSDAPPRRPSRELGGPVDRPALPSRVVMADKQAAPN